MKTSAYDIAGRLVKGRYDLREFVSATGRFAEIWRARDRRLACDVIVKLLKIENLQREERSAPFFEEISILRRLDGVDGVLRLIDQGQMVIEKREAPTLPSDRVTVPYLVLELAEGRSLFELIEAKLDESTILKIAIDICRVMREVHARDVVHNDLRHEHVFVRDAGTERQKVTIIDWNLSRDLRVEVPGEFRSTFDIEDFGELLYNMCTGFKLTSRAADPKRGLTPIQAGVPTIDLVPKLQAAPVKEAPIERMGSGVLDLRSMQPVEAE